MKPFNVIIYNINREKFEPYNVMNFFVDEYIEDEEKLTTFDEFKKFVEHKSIWMFWSRCEYEIILSDWPPSGVEEKWDIHRQIMMNIDIVTEILMENVKQ